MTMTIIMAFSRIIRRHHLLPSKRSKRGICFILFTSLILFMTLFFMLKETYNNTRHGECPSEINHRSKVLAGNKIHVVPSNVAVNVDDDTSDHQHAKTLTEVECIDLFLPDHSEKFKMCIYDPNRDQVISKYIKVYGAWEKENVAEMLKAFKIYPELLLLDLGSNIGAYTLPAAMTGSQVIAVDALRENLNILQRSLMVNDLTCLVTLVHNAVHGKRGQMKITLNPENIGGSVVMDIPNFRVNKVHKSDKVDAICLDDMIPMVKGRDVFLKMDIEGSEEAALACAHNFFKQVNVKVILMEWMTYRHNEKGTSSIKAFLESQNMIATWGIDRNRVIDPAASNSWPDNVFWMQK